MVLLRSQAAKMLKFLSLLVEELVDGVVVELEV
jgi:hypothetical protein